MSSLDIHVECISAGQARAYGPSEYKYNITFPSQEKTGYDWLRNIAIGIAWQRATNQSPTRPAILKETEGREWWQYYVKEVRSIENGFFVYVYQEYLD